MPPIGCLGIAQQAEQNWARLKRKEKKIQPKNDRDKPKPNVSPTLTPSSLSFKLPLKMDSGL